ncbi:MAG: helix-turn-helix domain-containing protein [Defluviitaleaceae bacterium]|nr:helix-turn-helix domain-containing protein [Defluviitaleaceae bacterium]
MKRHSIVRAALLSFAIGDRVKQLRESRGMSIKALAEEMGARKYHVKMVEWGCRNISAYNCLRLHEIFNVSVHYIVTGEEFEAEQNESGESDESI